jgi:phage terminase small subunit
MPQRGRKSVAALTVVARLTPQRPPPPEHLTEQQAEEWRAIVDRMPSGYFSREMFGLLAAYCQHASAARVLTGLIDSFKVEWLADPDGLARFNQMLAMRERETKSMANLATKLRMTPQSRYLPNTVARKIADVGAGGPKPWDGPDAKADELEAG